MWLVNVMTILSGIALGMALMVFLVGVGVFGSLPAGEKKACRPRGHRPAPGLSFLRQEGEATIPDCLKATNQPAGSIK